MSGWGDYVLRSSRPLGASAYCRVIGEDKSPPPHAVVKQSVPKTNPPYMRAAITPAATPSTTGRPVSVFIVVEKPPPRRGECHVELEPQAASQTEFPILSAAVASPGH